MRKPEVEYVPSLIEQVIYGMVMLLVLGLIVGGIR